MDQVMIYSNTLFKVNKSFNFPWLLTETYKFDFLSRHVRLTFNFSEIKWLEFATELPANLTQVFPPRTSTQMLRDPEAETAEPPLAEFYR